MLAHDHRPETLPHDADDPPGARTKAKLYCPDCGRAAPPDDWDHRFACDGLALVCPDCETLLTVRPV